MHGHTLTTFPGRPEDTLFPRPEEFHCEVFTDLLEKLLAVLCEQEMTMGEVAMKLDSLILMQKKKWDLSVAGVRGLKATVDTITIMSWETGVLIAMRGPVAISGPG